LHGLNKEEQERKVVMFVVVKAVKNKKGRFE